MNIVIAMAGAGTRFQKVGIKQPKPLIAVLGKTLIEYSIESFDVSGRYIFITREYEQPEDNRHLSEILKNKRPESIEIRLKNLTSGATESVLMAESLINNDEPLVIFNCDQFINWNAEDFLKVLRAKDPDAAVVLYNSRDPKNSFAEIIDGKVVRMVEKKAISEHALIGFHYWKKGSDFVASANKLMEKFRLNGRPECYISETFNYMYKPDILPYHISANEYIPLGTPEDVAKYIGKVKEFKTPKLKTLLIDIDGTILKHHHTISDVYENPAEILPGVKEKINHWDSQGHKIIFMTARKESTRQLTEQQLRQFGLAWDHLIMGVGGGQRVVINDKLSQEDNDRALAVNVITNDGFLNTSWEDIDL